MAPVRMTRVCRSLAVVLVVGSCRGLRRAGVQPLHRAPHEARGEEQQREGHDSAASEKRHHGQEHSAIPTHRLGGRLVVIVPGHAIRR